MPSIKKLLQAAAGNAGGDNLYVEDVFSTYLYTGTGTSQVIENGIALGDSNYGSSVEFDGVGDYVSRSSGLSGQSDSHTFTLSVWVFNQVSSGYARIFGIKNSSGSNNLLYLQIDSNNYLNVMTFTDGVSQMQGIDAGNSPPGYTVPPNQWSNILISANLATSTWHLSINDSYSSVTPYNPSGYTDNIDFSTSSGSTLGTLYGSYFKGRITQLYLDNTFRDLSQTSVRRTFINSNGTPATGLASLNPVLYLPLDDTNSVGTNLGTGGAYSVSGSPTQLSAGGPYIQSGFGKGGMVWFKTRSTGNNHNIYDTERGNGKLLYGNTTEPQYTNSTDPWSPTSNGFNTGSDFGGSESQNGSTTVSWTFRKTEKFFDVVTYTGNGSAGRTIAHNLGSTPGMLIVKCTNASSTYWIVWHSSLTGNNYLVLNEAWSQSSNGEQNLGNNVSLIPPTSTVFTVGDTTNTNANGSTYVAYLFASDAGGFGDDGDENIIKCGSWNENSTNNITIDCGFEPAFVMFKCADAASPWYMVDSMRGIPTPSSGTATGNYISTVLQAESNNAEGSANAISLTSNGFIWYQDGRLTNTAKWIYVAIRRPMKTPESGTEVFNPVAYSGNGAGQRTIDLDLTLDMLVTKGRNAAIENIMYSRLSGTSKRLVTSSSANEASSSTNVLKSLDQEGITIGSDVDINGASYTYIAWAFKRAKGFFDTVMYTGNGVAGHTITHNLGVVPELIITKSRSLFFSGPWRAFSAYLNGETNPWEYELDLASTSSESSSDRMNNTAPTSTVFSLNDNSFVNANTYTYVAHLFASVEGVSKVGTYTGTGDTGTNVIDCGFSAGARFVLIKQVSSAGNWYCFDTARGITDGNAGISLQWNRANAEVSNSGNVNIDPNASGFEFAGDVSYNYLNTLNARYIFLAIAQECQLWNTECNQAAKS